MLWNRFKQSLGIIMVGDALISLLEPRPSATRPRVDLGRAPRTISKQAAGVALIGTGLWLALRRRP